jgi:hypothetical protein
MEMAVECEAKIEAARVRQASFLDGLKLNSMVARVKKVRNCDARKEIAD